MAGCWASTSPSWPGQPQVIDQMGDVYPELRERADFILRTIQHEEERFLRTLDLGLTLLEELMAEVKAQGAERVARRRGLPPVGHLRLPAGPDPRHCRGERLGHRHARLPRGVGAAAPARPCGRPVRRRRRGQGPERYAGVLERLPAGGVEHVYLTGHRDARPPWRPSAGRRAGRAGPARDSRSRSCWRPRPSTWRAAARSATPA